MKCSINDCDICSPERDFRALASFAVTAEFTLTGATAMVSRWASALKAVANQPANIKIRIEKFIV
jgi:hypothetical protein